MHNAPNGKPPEKSFVGDWIAVYLKRGDGKKTNGAMATQSTKDNIYNDRIKGAITTQILM